MKIGFLLFFMGLGTLCYSQQQISINAGYGGALHDPYSHNFFRLPYHPFNGILSLSMSGRYHRGIGSRSRLNTGLQYGYKGYDNLHQLTIPLGLDFQFGKNVRFLAGFGTNTKITLHHAPAPSRNYTFAQFGVYYELGINFKLNDQWWLSCTYQMNSDLTKLYYSKNTSPGGSKYTQKEKEFDALLRVGFTYNLPEK